MPAGKFSNTFNRLSHNLMVYKQNKVVNVGVTLRLLGMLPMKKKKEILFEIRKYFITFNHVETRFGGRRNLEVLKIWFCIKYLILKLKVFALEFNHDFAVCGIFKVTEKSFWL